MRIKIFNAFDFLSSFHHTTPPHPTKKQRIKIALLILKSFTPLKTNMTLDNPHFYIIGDTSSSGWFSNVMLVFRGVNDCNPAAVLRRWCLPLLATPCDTLQRCHHCFGGSTSGSTKLKSPESRNEHGKCGICVS